MRYIVFKNTKGQLSLGGIIGAVIGIVVLVAVAIPVTNDVTAEQNLTGSTATIVNLLPLFFGLAALLAVAALFVFRRG